MTEYTVSHYYDNHFTNRQKIEADNPMQAIEHVKKTLAKEGCAFTNADVFEADDGDLILAKSSGGAS